MDCENEVEVIRPADDFLTDSLDIEFEEDPVGSGTCCFSLGLCCKSSGQ